jgi:hypothetical protein
MKLHQGDVLLSKVEGLPDLGACTIRKDGCVAVGEFSGHAHRFSEPERVKLFVVPGAKLTPADVGVRYLEVTGAEPVLLRHEEHDPVAVPPGLYTVRFPHEWDYEREESRLVAD